MKTFVITVAKTFPGHHPKKGQPTHFKQQILEGNKIHTIRLNYALWKARIAQVNEGKAILSLREWSAKPYSSKQVEFMQLTRAGLELFDLRLDKVMYLNRVRIFRADYETVATHDGLTLPDLHAWFKAGKNTITNAALIHFTDFKYMR